MNREEYLSRLETIQGRISEHLDWPENIPKTPIKEGVTEFFVESTDQIYDATSFFNPVMVVNRDLTLIAVITYAKKYDKQMRILDPLGGIGVRALRLAVEAKDWISQIIVNDYSNISTAIASYNIHNNNLQDTIIQFKREAKSIIQELAEKNFKFHYLDLDPFGPPTPFIDSIWSAFAISGLASITATDMTALCGVYPESCLRKYGAIPLNNFHTHETAARILIGTIVQSAARQEFGVVPLLTVSVDHYAKVFVKIRKSRGAANLATSQIGFSFTCRECFQIYYIGYSDPSPSCCGVLDKAGPLWTGSLFDTEWCKLFVEELEMLELPSTKRIMKILQEGIHAANLNGYYALDEIGKKLHLPQPKISDIEEMLLEHGYRVVRTQFRKQSIRTDAPSKQILDIFRELVPKNTE